MEQQNFSLIYLLQSGYTHADIKTLFISWIISPEWVWEKTKTWENPLELPESRMTKIREKQKKVDESQIHAYLKEKDIRVVSIHDEHYPEKLKSIKHAPSFFFLRGTLKNSLPMISVVWSRKHTPYAEKILRRILPDIIHAGIWIVSGWATGVDSLWHEIALENHGYTIAIFGTWIDRCYPPNNKKLFESIIDHWGAVISHFPLWTGPELYNFPIRNELVAGLSNGVFIPEAWLSSGTLITAQLALEHGRDVFSVPGDIDRITSEGTNMLISSGQAKCVRCSGDILEEYFDLKSIGQWMTPIVKTPPTFSTEVEKVLYENIEKWYSSIDELLRETQLDMTDILTTLAMLEIAGHVNMDEMGRYQIK